MNTRQMAQIDLVIVGAGGHGLEVASYAAGIQSVKFAGFIDDAKPRGGGSGGAILGDLEELAALCSRMRPAPLYYLTAVGSNSTRKRLAEKIRGLGADNLLPWTLVHPSSHCGHDVEVEEGTCLAPGSIVTTHARIGKHCILNIKASVSHDCVVSDYCNLNPGSTVCGNVTLGEGCYIGAGATIKERISIGAWTTVGAGAVVIEDLPGGVTVVGVPARIVGQDRGAGKNV